MQPDPVVLISWMLVGLVAGWLTGRVMKGCGYGWVVDSVVGLLGALVGGVVVISLGRAGFLGSLLIAALAAILFVAVLRILTRGRTAV